MGLLFNHQPSDFNPFGVSVLVLSRKSPSSHLSVGAFIPEEQFRYVSNCYSSLEEELGPFLSLNYCFLTAFPLFLHSFVRLRSVITESCSRASTVAMIRSQNGLSEKRLILCQESHEWFCFSGDPAPYLLKPGQESPLGTLLCPLLREACCSAPGPWPLSSISYC